MTRMPLLSARTWPFCATTTSPGSMSRINVAPMASSAQDSDEKMTHPSSLPMQSGRKPLGSRTAMSFFPLIKTRLYAPTMYCMALRTASSSVFVRRRSRTIIWEMISASPVVWKMAPCISASFRSCALFASLPLCAMHRLPLTCRMTMGWAQEPLKSEEYA